jgi:hypothetical protein
LAKRLRGGILAVIGYLLSPLSWWNDAFINIPIAYVFASLLSLIHRGLFTPTLVAGYWLTNVAGLLMMHKGVGDAVREQDRTPPRKRLLLSLAAGTGYTMLVGALALTGILKPPAFLRGRAARAFGPIHFAREEIELNIRPGLLEVQGLYHFRNSSPEYLTARIFYPFPLDSIHAYPDSILLPGSQFVRSDKGISFALRFRPETEDSFFVYYRQPLRGNTARYIVTTTRQWKQAIDEARFRIIVPRAFQGVKLSYPPDHTVETDTSVTYHFVRCHFYPSKDVIVTWR